MYRTEVATLHGAYPKSFPAAWMLGFQGSAAERLLMASTTLSSHLCLSLLQALVALAGYEWVLQI